MLLDGKTIMITGCSSGIGAAAARLFAAEGANVVLMARREERLRALAQEIADEGSEALVAAGDVSRTDDVDRAVTAAVERFGRLDAAFNNAGWASVGRLLHETDDADFDRVMDVNVRGVWNCLRRQIPAMLADGRGGSIVNVSSVAGVQAPGSGAPYVAAKHAVLGLTRAAAAEYGERGVRVNALVMGSVRTELMDQVLDKAPELEHAFVHRSVQKRMAAPREAAEAAAWLCSDRASFVTGAAMAVDGGWTAA
ncbi:SDR family NAD(P)-dependent oxidoreductase [Streptomyces sp. NPDC056296]|uniref:SDR family NAD(P)-dependent oxidoreductase n=1 Tax=Streptomyces sp. NPDC056296 TaxID=3345775 RepID=UPI0035E0E5E9